MSLIRLGFWAASGASTPITYWLSSIKNDDFGGGRAFVLDSSGNGYLNGHSNITGSNQNFLLAKYNQAGEVQWQRTLGGASTDKGYGIAVDSGNNIYAVGETASDGQGESDLFIAKYNSSGVIQWQRTLGGSTQDTGSSVAVDSSDNVYVFGRSEFAGAGSFDFLLAKYDSSGSLQWQVVLGGSSSEDGNAITIDASGNVYVAGDTQSEGQGGREFFIAKYNSSGVIQWQRIIGGSSFDYAYGIATDSSGNVYATGVTESQGQGSRELLFVKYNSSGTLQFQKMLGGTDHDWGYSLYIDSTDNIYLGGRTQSTGEGFYDSLIVKYNTSGVIQFQRTLGGVDYDEIRSLAIDSNNSIWAFGFTGSVSTGDYYYLLAKLPGDGSLTGTYVIDGVDMVYAASSLTAGTSTLTAATSTLTAATSTLTSASSTLTSSSASLATDFVEIPQ